MIVQSQLDGQLYEVPDTYGGLAGYQEFVDPGLGLPFLAALIPKVAAIAGKALPAVGKIATSILPGILPGFPGGQRAAPATPVPGGPTNVTVSPALVDAIIRAVQARTPAAQPNAAPVIIPRRRRSRRRTLGAPPGYGYSGYSHYGWPGY